jgi:pimeloyl-ACP methyl ester carboxylesterase
MVEVVSLRLTTIGAPGHMLTGDSDWSTTAEMTETTARGIIVADILRMKGLDHFPAAENPARLAPYLTEAL